MGARRPGSAWRVRERGRRQVTTCSLHQDGEETDRSVACRGSANSLGPDGAGRKPVRCALPCTSFNRKNERSSAKRRAFRQATVSPSATNPPTNPPPSSRAHRSAQRCGADPGTRTTMSESSTESHGVLGPGSSLRYGRNDGGRGGLRDSEGERDFAKRLPACCPGRRGVCRRPICRGPASHGCFWTIASAMGLSRRKRPSAGPADRVSQPSLLPLRHQRRGRGRCRGEARTAKTTLYKNFASKEKLVEAVLEHEGKAWRDWFIGGLESGKVSPRPSLRACFPLLQEWFARSASTAARSSTPSASTTRPTTACGPSPCATRHWC